MMNMKKLLIAGTCIAALSISAFAQGTVNFANRVTGQLDAPIYDVDTTTKLAGTGYWAQLYSGGVAQGKPMNFRTGSGAGYFFSDAVTLNNVAAGGQANLQVKAWAGGAGSTYENSMPNGKSPEFTITTGGGGTPPDRKSVV